MLIRFDFTASVNCLLLLCAVVWTPQACGQDAARAASSDGRIRVIFRGDDMGAAHSINEACQQCVTRGVVRSVEVIVPGPWFAEAAAMLRKTPQVDVGIHLALTSEWENVKWGPVSLGASSLVDENGYFFPMTRQRAGWPAGTGFMESSWRIEQVERELRRQIELGKKRLPNVTHLTAHMGTAVCTAELRALVSHLAQEYQLPMGVPDLRRPPGFGGPHLTPQQKEERLVEILTDLKPGLWMFVTHPALDTPEMRAIGHLGYTDVAADRQGDTAAMTSDKVMAVIKKRGIQLVSYGDVLK